MMKYVLQILLCLLAVTSALSAQTRFTVGVRTLALDQNITQAERYVKTKEGYETLVFMIRHPGEIIEAYVDETGLPIFRKIQVPGQQDTYQVASSVNFTEGAKSILVLGWGLPENERYLSVDDNLLGAGYNDWLMINTSSRTVGLRIGKGEKPFMIEPNRIEKCKVASPEGLGAAVLGRAKFDGEVKTFYSTYWPIRSGERSIVVFFEQGDRMRLRKISDTLVAKEKDGGI